MKPDMQHGKWNIHNAVGVKTVVKTKQTIVAAVSNISILMNNLL